MKLTIGKRIVGGCAASLAVTVGLGLFAYLRVRAIDKEMQCLATDALPGVRWSGELNALTERSMKLTLMDIAADSPEQRAEIDASSAETEQAYKQYADQITQSDDRANLERLQALRARSHEVQLRALELGRAMKSKEAIDLFTKEGYAINQQMQEAVLGIVKWNIDYGDRAAERGTAAVGSAKTVICIAIESAVAIA